MSCSLSGGKQICRILPAQPHRFYPGTFVKAFLCKFKGRVKEKRGSCHPGQCRSLAAGDSHHQLLIQIRVGNLHQLNLYIRMQFFILIQYLPHSSRLITVCKPHKFQGLYLPAGCLFPACFRLIPGCLLCPAAFPAGFLTSTAPKQCRHHRNPKQQTDNFFTHKIFLLLTINVLSEPLSDSEAFIFIYFNQAGIRKTVEKSYIH